MRARGTWARATIVGTTALLAGAVLAPGAGSAGVQRVFWGVTISGVQTHTATSTDSGVQDPDSPPDPCPKESTSSETLTFESVTPVPLGFTRFRGVTTTSYFNRGDYSGGPAGRPLKGTVTRTNGGRIVCERSPQARPQDCGTKAFTGLSALLTDVTSGRGRRARFNLQDNDFFQGEGYKDCQDLAPKNFPSLFDRRIQDDQFGQFFVVDVPYARLFDRRKRRFSVRGDFSQPFREGRALRPGETATGTLRIRYTLTFVRQARRR